MNLLKKLFRDVIEAKGQFISIMVVVFLGSFFLTGLSSGSRLLGDYADSYYQEYNLSDIWMYYSNISEDEAFGVAEIEGVKQYELRFTYQSTTLEKKLIVHTIDEDSVINQLYIVDGELPQNPFDIAVDYEFANANYLAIGDSMTYTVDSVEVNYTVTAFIESPEYVTKIAEDGNGFPEHDIYGIAYVHYSTVPELSALTGIQIEYDELLVTVETGFEYNEVIRAVENHIQNDTYLYGYTRDLHPSYTALAGDIEQFESLSLIFPVIFFVVAALMTYIAMRRIIDSQKTQIGIMKALGVKKNKIMTHYVCFPVLPCVVGALAGGVIGSLVFPQLLLIFFADTYDLPNVGTKIYMNLVAPGVLVSTAFGLFAAFFSCRKTLKLTASAAMRPPLPKAGKSIFLERLSGFWNTLSGRSRIVFRNIFCNKKRAVMSCIGISGSVALMITGFAMYDSTQELIERTYSEIYQYDAIVSMYYYTSDHGEVTITDPYSVPIPDEAQGLFVPVLNFEVNQADKTTFGAIRALESNSDFFRVIDDDMTEIAVSNDGVIISKRLADSHNLAVGDEIEIKLTDSYYGGATITARIVDISEQYLTQDIYCSPSFLENQGIELKPLTIYVNVGTGMTVEQLIEFYSDVREVSSVTSLEDQRVAVETYTQSMVAILAVMIIGAMLLSFAVIYNISVINIMERRTTLATMKVLGYGKGKISGVFEIENVLLTVVGVVIGIPLGFALMKAVFDASTTDEMSFPYVVNILSIIVSCGLAFLFTLISGLPVRKKVQKVHMTETLKLIE